MNVTVGDDLNESQHNFDAMQLGMSEGKGRHGSNLGETKLDENNETKENGVREDVDG